MMPAASVIRWCSRLPVTHAWAARERVECAWARLNCVCVTVDEQWRQVWEMLQDVGVKTPALAASAQDAARHREMTANKCLLAAEEVSRQVTYPYLQPCISSILLAMVHVVTDIKPPPQPMPLSSFEATTPAPDAGAIPAEIGGAPRGQEAVDASVDADAQVEERRRRTVGYQLALVAHDVVMRAAGLRDLSRYRDLPLCTCLYATCPVFFSMPRHFLCPPPVLLLHAPVLAPLAGDLRRRRQVCGTDGDVGAQAGWRVVSPGQIVQRRRQ